MPEKIYSLKIIPNAKANQLVEQTDTFLKIKLVAPAHEGKANAALLVFLSQHFKIPKSQIEILRGAKARNKLVKIIL